jgi:hypothetical protein
MPSVGFEPTTAATERLQPYALDRTAAGIGLLSICTASIYISLLWGYWTAGVKTRLREWRVVTYVMKEIQNSSERTVEKSSVFFWSSCSSTSSFSFSIGLVPKDCFVAAAAAVGVVDPLGGECSYTKLVATLRVVNGGLSTRRIYSIFLLPKRQRT